jgi:hypothetical protein
MSSDAQPDPTPVAQDAQTLTDAVAALEAQGYTGQFRVLELARVQCLTCRREFAGTRGAIESLRRLEGASDPDDMLAVVALVCPECRARGSLVLGYGPDASLEESQLLLELQDERGAGPTGAAASG